jgi:hypothetical protein
VQKIKTQFHIQYFVPENRAVYELMWRNMVEPDRTQMTIWRMRFACWMTKATDTHSQCVILNDFPPQNGYANALQCYVIDLFTLLVLFAY